MSNASYRSFGEADRFLDHDSPAKQYEEAGLAARHIVGTALKALGVDAMGQGAARA